MNPFAKFNFIFIFLLLIFAQPCLSENVASKEQIQDFAKIVYKKYGIDPEYTQKILSEAQYLPNAIRISEKPYKKLTWDAYRKRMVTPERIRKGVNFWAQNKKILDEAHRKYGVQSSFIIAILGIETTYGENTGNTRVIDALSTFAFHHPRPRRSQFFKDELAAFIDLAHKLHKDPIKIYGSLDGGMGMPQFMPSTYLKYAVDHGTHRPDLFTNKRDIVFSVSNFFKKHGWDKDKPITSRAKVQGKQYEAILVSHPKKPLYTVEQLKTYGVTPEGPISPDHKANLISLDGKNGEFWLGFRNYYVIKHYNNSHWYAMSVYQLSQAIAKEYKKTKR
jgi:membrane-bound lytic murein transglycosylase B